MSGCGKLNFPTPPSKEQPKPVAGVVDSFLQVSLRTAADTMDAFPNQDSKSLTLA